MEKSKSEKNVFSSSPCVPHENQPPQLMTYCISDIMTLNIDGDQRILPDAKGKGDGLDTCRLSGEEQHIWRDKDGKSVLPWWRGRLAAARVDSPELCSPSCLLWSPVWLSSSMTASPSSPLRPAHSLSTEDGREQTHSTLEMEIV